MSQTFKFEKIFVDEKVKDHEFTGIVLQKTKGIPVKIIKDAKKVVEDLALEDNSITRGKRFILLTEKKGGFLKPCPGTSEYLCCDYYVLNISENCVIDCTYCILQEYLMNPFITLFANWEDSFNEINGFLSEKKNDLIRLGTGELSDSLAIEDIFPVSEKILEFLKNRKNVIFEFKTKSENIKKFLNLEPINNAVFSFSLNTEKIAKEEELKAPEPLKRIEAASKLAEEGWRVGFHFDPIVHYKNWEIDYHRVIKLLFSKVEAEKIAWISLGTLRFNPKLKPIIEKRFPKSKIIYGELIKGEDGKLRYFRPLRVELYKKIYNFIKENIQKYSRDKKSIRKINIPVYLCMENEDVWEEVFKWTPANSSVLNNYILKLFR
ncbi:MAG: spore photoproduct lyase family protein [Acidobacteriota bacterium]